MHSLITPSDYWLSVPEASKRSGKSHNRLRLLIHTGRLVAVKRYGQWQINAESLRDYVSGTHSLPQIRDFWHRPIADIKQDDWD